MPRKYTFPYLFDERKSLLITDLKKLGYFNYNKITSGIVNWTMRGENTGNISIKVTISDNANYVDFNYNCNDEKYQYRVYLVFTKSNLNKGKIWYFKCKFTGMRCRKLHLIQGKFQHRTALKSGMYSKQTQSKKWRVVEKKYGNYFSSENIYSELYSKHFRKYYKGKPTKRYLKLIDKIKEIEKVSMSDIERLLLSK